jgi:creatinine amidohydrolase
MPSRPYILAETTWATVRETRYEVAVLPWGATEAHNLHLPYATDTIQCDALAADAARVAWESGARVVVLPSIPFGVNTGQFDIPLCLNMNPSTQAALLADLVQVVERAGVRKLVIFNGHGGNDFRQMIRELQPKTRLFVCTLNWWQSLDMRRYFDEPGDHAGEAETSVVMDVAPGLVRPLSEAGDGREIHFRIDGLRERWVWAQREWPRISLDTGVGNPKAATAEKGARFRDALSKRIGDFFIALADADPLDMYERPTNGD